ncbi:MAG: (2Fe-2S) ferredoxin domain-containing protein, partial [Deltaproteobacteria bacterium]|nr:(2Fe-2S) ferredoxin domain-containing protein [Deltaproteobacteria bacterium]
MAAEQRTVLICRGTGCESTRSPEIQAALDADLRDSDVKVKFTGCHGMCQQGPIVIVEPEGTFYANVKTKDAPKIVESLADSKQPVEGLYYKDPATKAKLATYHDIPFYA